ncbi:hypothetical protein BMS3Abin06_01399 [bacterium BMS3Abin06]|nr:hypothetical protein BMS3Abin06_01399 [bacterium BMS3Abin06]
MATLFFLMKIGELVVDNLNKCRGEMEAILEPEVVKEY